ncbi:MAG: hypothetical protein ACE5GX_10665 [Thermoanaerobaculia bacterium]
MKVVKKPHSASGLRVAALATVLLTATAIVNAQTPLGSQFTYQGKLDHLGSPVNATADFQFTLWDAEIGGTMVGTMVPVNNVTAVNGLFSAELDFGVPAISGGARWLRIAVRSPAGGGAFSTLTPRQPITPSPYSIQTRGIFVDANNKVGIGTAHPADHLHSRGTHPTLWLDDDIDAGTGQLRINQTNSNGQVVLAINSKVTITGVQHNTPPAYAYGFVGNTGSLISGSENILATARTGTGRYEVTFSDGLQFHRDIVLVQSENPRTTVGYQIVSGKLRVTIYHVFFDEDEDASFHFVVYRP